MSAALPRLKQRADFLRIARDGRKSAAPGLIVQMAPAIVGDDTTSKGKAELRVGFTASRKVGNAVARNRARRRLRALAAEILPTQARPGFDYVLIARAATVGRPFARLREDLLRALAKLDALGGKRSIPGLFDPGTGGGDAAPAGR